MNSKNARKRALEKMETIFEEEARLKLEAKILAEKFKHIKPTKYLLKC